MEPESADARRADSDAGSYRSAYLLGLFSGAASACCAPVLTGVAVLSGATGSFPVALSVGLAYVAGMVAPLALIALIWDGHRERATRVLSDRTISLAWGAHRRTMSLGTALSGGLMIVMGVLAIVVAFTGPGMASGGWQTRLSAWLQHMSAVVLHTLSWLPGWVMIAVLIVAAALLARRVIRQVHDRRDVEPIGAENIKE
ncbi:cytochrome c biogenesis protein CcdA [Nocardia nova]|uniref:cytochrome c biogenesis protein CcdA n=1 Tax=Nocardia nova TaxID=37330 RepID=UPI0037A7510C